MNDGDTIFGVATRAKHLSPSGDGPGAPFLDAGSRVAVFNVVLEAAADVFARACTLAILRATGLADLPAYRDLVPSAMPGFPRS